jgi:hypothetical protein
MMHPADRRNCLHRLYLQDGPAAKSAAGENEKWRQLATDIPSCRLFRYLSVIDGRAI